MLYLGPSNNVYVLARFGAQKGDYMFHCHNLVHEDNDMMRAFKVMKTMDGPNKEYAFNTPYLLNPLYNIVYANYKYSDPMLAETAAKPTINVLPLSESANITLGLNVYRIFYPSSEDLSATRNSTNPWIADFCPVTPSLA